MLAYRHAFHAGNHADVLKHVVFAQVLQHMGQKDKPYWLIDTHAGGGGYALGGKEAQTNAEYLNGIARIWQRQDAPPAVAEYLQLVRDFNPGGKLAHYPGSPEIARRLLRTQDRLRLYELHPTEVQILASHQGGFAHTEVHHADGFEGLKAQLPPPSRRGVLLIDPSYEIKTDYAKVLTAVRAALQRFAECVIVIWYPQLNRTDSATLPKRLQALAPKGWLHARLSVQQADAQGFGLVGSGMFVINPPWTLHEALKPALPWLRDALAQHAGAQAVLNHHAV